MSRKSTISISFKIGEGADGFKQLTTDAEGLRKVMQSTVTEAEKLNKKVVNLAALSTSIDSIGKSLNDVCRTLRGLTEESAAIVIAETKLTTVMQQRMGATEAEIQSIKDLAEAQQKLGVIEDDVQLSGAQQIATFLKEKESLETLLPAMNNLLAQQKGLNATAQDAVTVGNLMGKVMQGQTSALTRVGITFTEAEEKVLKFGDEQARAAMLAQVITNNVGEMNAALAKTDAGQMKQLETSIDGLRESLGGLVQWATPFLTIAANATIALTGVAKFYGGAKLVVTTISGWHIKQKLLNVAMIIGAGNTAKGAQAMRIYSSAAKGSAAATKAFGVALKGMLISSGVGIAIAALGGLLSALSSKSEEAEERARELAEAEAEARKAHEEWKRSLTDVSQAVGDAVAKEVSALEELYRVAKDDTKSRKERAAAIQELKKQWPEYFSQISSERIEIDKLTKSYEAAKNAILDMATVKAINSKLESNAGEKVGLQLDQQALQKEYENFLDIYTALQGLPSSGGAVRATTIKKALEGKKYQGRDAYSVFQEGGFKGPDGKPVQGALALELTDKGDKSRWYANVGQNLSAVNNAYEKALEGIETQLQEIDSANDELINMRNEAATRLKNSIGGISPTTTTTTTPENSVKQDPEQELNAQRTALINEYVTASEERRVAIMNEIAALDEQIATVKELKAEAARIPTEAPVKAETKPESNDPVFNADAKSIKDISDNIRILNKQLEEATTLEAATDLNQQIKYWEDLADAMRNAGKAGEEAKSGLTTMREGWDAVKGVGGGIESLTSALEGNGNAWQTVVGIVDGFLGIYDGVMAIIGIVKTLTATNEAGAVAETKKASASVISVTAQAVAAGMAETNAAAQLPLIAANKATAASYMELAAAAFYASHAFIPFAGFGIATGFIAAATSIVEGIGAMPFANGGIVSGPTIGLIGEYAGARNNPEVVAPLNKLRSMLDDGDRGVGRVEFEVRGDRLFGVLERHKNKLARR